MVGLVGGVAGCTEQAPPGGGAAGEAETPLTWLQPGSQRADHSRWTINSGSPSPSKSQSLS